VSGGAVNAGEPDSGSIGRSFPRRTRVTAGDDIRSLFRRGKRRKTRSLDVFVSSSLVAYPRIAIVVPKPRRKLVGFDVGGAAVSRNRLKRRLRELSRTELLPALRRGGRSVDVLIRARPEAFSATFTELREEIAVLVEWLCSNRY